MEAPSPTGVLREEHQLILKVLDVLEVLLARVAEGAPGDWHAIEKCTQFFRLFADACHHGKEQELLFPVLESRGVPREGGPIGVMLYEHEQGRALVARMREHLTAAHEGEAAASEIVLESGHAFLILLRNHIAKEDNILFMMADRLVDGGACQQLCADYANVCTRRFEGRSKEELRQLAADLQSAALP
jgi:hemerythrin-like domain-containing protein